MKITLEFVTPSKLAKSKVCGLKEGHFATSKLCLLYAAVLSVYLGHVFISVSLRQPYGAYVPSIKPNYSSCNTFYRFTWDTFSYPCLFDKHGTYVPSIKPNYSSCNTFYRFTWDTFSYPCLYDKHMEPMCRVSNLTTRLAIHFIGLLGTRFHIRVSTTNIWNLSEYI